MPHTGLSETTKQATSLSQILSRHLASSKFADKKAAHPPDAPQKLNILIVEDERIVARDLQVRLNNFGYEVTGIASSRQDAMKAAELNRPDLVLMDIRLNGAPDGIEAARDLRMDFNLPVIFLTGHSDNNTLARARLSEPFGYILKPFENRELVAAIETAVYKHRAETRLREANTRLRLAQRAGRVGVFDWDAQTGELHVTPELEELRQAVPGTIRTLDDLWGGANDGAQLKEMQDRFSDWMLSDRGEESWEHPILVSTFLTRWLQVRASVYRDTDGRPVRIIGTEVDITSRKQMENALLAKESELERSNAELQAYAYTIAHDLQEPVRTLVCGVELIERDLAGTLELHHQRLFSFVRNSADRLRNMIGGLLEYSRLSQQDEEEAHADCNQILAAVMDSLKTLIEETGARIEASQLPVVAVSEHRVGQLFQNLIGNALKFRRPDTGPVVEISCERNDEFWRFAIADNGVGFEMVYAERIFGVFKRLHNRQVEGTGIGLSVCKRIVESAGGHIRAESSPGEGSKFIFTLPAAKKG